MHLRERTHSKGLRILVVVGVVLLFLLGVVVMLGLLCN